MLRQIILELQEMITTTMQQIYGKIVLLNDTPATRYMIRDNIVTPQTNKILDKLEISFLIILKFITDAAAPSIPPEMPPKIRSIGRDANNDSYHFRFPFNCISSLFYKYFRNRIYT
jgi:hypothetical protein